MSVRHKISLAALVLLLVSAASSLFTRKETELAFFAVGQGDSTLFRTDGRAILIDTGPAGAGERVVIRELRRRGISKLDMVVLTHPDADHIAALPEIARKIHIRSVVVPAYFKSHPSLTAALGASNIGADRLAWVAGPSQSRIGAFSLFMDVPPWQEGNPDNEGSLMAKIVSGQASVTLTGDAGFLEENDMMRKGSWSAQILKLGHHGSRFSSGDAWLDHVHPEIAIVSCGRDNNYGHPSPEVLSNCSKRGIRVDRTDRQGTLSYKVVDGKFQR